MGDAPLTMSTVALPASSHLSPIGVFSHATGSVTFMRLPSSRYQSVRMPTAAPAGSRLDSPVWALTETGMATIGNAIAAANSDANGCSRD